MCNRVHGLKESITFDDIQQFSRNGVRLVMVSESDDIIVVFRSFSPPTTC